MSRMQTFAKYVIWLIAFYFFSYCMIYVGLNSMYKNIEVNKNLPEGVTVDIAQATSVNRKNLWKSKIYFRKRFKWQIFKSKYL